MKDTQLDAVAFNQALEHLFITLIHSSAWETCCEYVKGG